MNDLKTLPSKNIREGMIKIEDEVRKLPNALIGDSPEYLALCPLKHTFADGCYIRELFMPKGMLFVTKIHKIKHPYFLLKGDCEILTEDGVKRIKGPFHGITPAGTKRVIFTHEDTIWVTVHTNSDNGQDLAKIEDRIIAKTYDEVPNAVIDIEAEEVKIIDFIDKIKGDQDEIMDKT
jgi:hypothetical protein